MPEEEKPNLEEIASQLAKVEEDYSLDQILPAMYDTFTSHSKQVDEKTGKKTYKTEFTSEEKEKISNDLFNNLSYHVHVNIYGMNMKTWEEKKTHKNPHGEFYADVAVEKYFGIDRDRLRKTLEAQPELNPDIIGEIIKKTLEHHRGEIHKPLYDKLDEKHVPHLKEWIKGKVEEYSLDPKISDRVEDMYTLKEVLPLYQEIAKAHYKRQKEAK